MHTRTLRVLAFALLPLLATGLAGCDEAAADLFSFPVDGVAFTFTFDDLGGGETASDVAAGTENILDAIQDQGFGPDAVSRVRLESGSAQIRILNAPQGANISALDDVSLRLTGGGTSTEVASAEGVSSGSQMVNEAPLDVSSENIAALTTGGDFGATLDVSTDADAPQGLYRFEVRFDVEVSVEGF